MKLNRSFIASLSMVVIASLSSGALRAATEPGTIAAIAASTPELSTLVTAAKKAGLVNLLNAPGGITVFAPTNAAFDKIPAGDLAALLANREALRQVILGHIIPFEITEQTFGDYVADFQNFGRGGRAWTTLNGYDVYLEGLFFDNTEYGHLCFPINSVSKGIEASNGLVYVIDSVIVRERGYADPSNKLCRH